MTSECCLELHSDDAAHKSVHMLVHPAECAAFLDCRKHAALVNFLDDERNSKHCGRLYNLECLHQK